MAPAERTFGMASRAAHLLLLSLLLASVSTAAPAGGPAAEQAFARGTALLGQADFAGAEAAYAEASRLDPANATYRGELDVLRRVVKLRADLAAATQETQWVRTAASLRAYYYSKGIAGEALPIDEEAHRRANSPATAAQLAETLLELGRDAQAAAVLAKQPAEALSPSARMLQGIALARTGEVAEARRIASTVQLPFAPTPNLMITRARLTAAAGDHAAAVALLKQAFEATPPSLLAQTRDRVRDCPDFAVLAANQGFGEALSAASKAAESSCSKGTSCGACPSRTSCGSSGGAAATPTTKAGGAKTAGGSR